MYLRGTRSSFELSCSQAGAFGETDRTVAVAAHTWSWWSPSHADTESVCFCDRRVNSLGNKWNVCILAIGLREDVVRTHCVSTCMRSIKGGPR